MATVAGSLAGIFITKEARSSDETPTLQCTDYTTIRNAARQSSGRLLEGPMIELAVILRITGFFPSAKARLEGILTESLAQDAFSPLPIRARSAA